MKPNENEKVPVAGELSLDEEKERLTRTKFPEEEFELPDQTAEDLGKEKETDA